MADLPYTADMRLGLIHDAGRYVARCWVASGRCREQEARAHAAMLLRALAAGGVTTPADGFAAEAGYIALGGDRAGRAQARHRRWLAGVGGRGAGVKRRLRAAPRRCARQWPEEGPVVTYWHTCAAPPGHGGDHACPCGAALPQAGAA